MNEFKIFSSEKCPYCIKAVQLLSQMGLPFTVTYPTDFNSVDEFKRAAIKSGAKLDDQGRFRVPQIFNNDEYIGGYTELTRYVCNVHTH